MMKITLILAVLVVSAYAKGLPFGFYKNQYANNLDTPDDDDQVAAGVGAQAGQQQVNEAGDTPDDQDEAAAAAAGQGAAAQGATTIAPVSGGGDDSSSSSSEEDVSDAPDSPFTAPVAGPLAGAGAAGQAGANAGDSSQDVIPAAGGPIYENKPLVEQVAAGGNSGDAAVDPGAGGPSMLKVHQEQVESQGRKSGALIAVTTLGLVAGVVATSFVAYKYKDAISARLGM